MAPVGISDKDRKILWGRSGNRCAMCRRVLVAERTATDDEAVVGDEAHIAARSAGGPRHGDCPPSATDRYENLILLCRVDHKLVDDQPLHYTSAHLRQLKAKHERWVNHLLSDAEPGRTTTTKPPRQLPAATRLLGRDTDLVALEELATEAIDEAGPAFLAIDGPPGVGCSALAVTLAHALAERFPDGQLYVDLREHAAAPHDAMAGLLRAFGVADIDVPEGGQREAAYRSIVAGRRVLVVVDNAWGFEQVAPFVPPSSVSMVLMTSRVVLGGPVGTRHRSIEPIAPEHAVELLRLTSRLPSYQWDADVAQQLAKLCGGLPLLLNGAAATVVDRTTSHAGLAKGLSVGRLTLAALDTVRTPVTATIAASYRRLPPASARAFRRLGAFAVGNVTRDVLTALGGIETVADHYDVCRPLATERLLSEPWPHDYALPTPFRLYAYHLLIEELGPHGAEQVFTEALSWYVANAKSAIFAWLGEYSSAADDPEMAEFHRRAGRVFFGLEIKNLVALLAEAFRREMLKELFELSDPVIESLAQSDEYELWDDTVRLVRDAAVQLTDDPTVSCLLLQALSEQYRRLDHNADAADCLWDARQIATEVSDQETFLDVTRLLVDMDEEELADAEAADEHDVIADIRLSLGELYGELGQPDVARNHLQAALSHFRQTANAKSEADALRASGDLALTTQRTNEAVALLEASVRLYRRLDDAEGVALALSSVAEAFAELGRTADARRAADESETLFAKLADDARATDRR